VLSRLSATWWAWGPTIAVAIALWPRLAIATLQEDEGVVTMWALQVASGKVPYRDFVVYAGPASAYLYGAAFSVLGSSLLLDRLLDALPILLSTFFLALIGRRLLPPGWAAAVALLWGIWLPALLGYGAYHFWGPALVVVTAWALLEPHPRPLLAGLAAALALLFYQAVAPAVLGGLLVAYLTRRRLRDLVEMAAVPLLVGALLAIILLATGAFSAFFDQTVIFTFGPYQKFNQLPFPWTPLLLGDTLNWHSGLAAYWEFPMFWLLGVVTPFVVAGYAVYQLWKVIRRRARLTNAGALAILSSGLLAAAFVSHAVGPILWLSAPLALVLLAARLRYLTASPSAGRRLAALAPVFLLLVAGLSPAPVGFWLSCTTNPAGPLVGVDTAAGPVCLRVKEAEQLREVQGIAGQAGGGAIAFLPDSPALYQLTASRPRVPSYWTLPHQTRQSELAWEERAMLDHVEYAVYVADPALDTGHPWQFDSFLATNYAEVGTYPGLTVYHRRPQAQNPVKSVTASITRSWSDRVRWL
jgi:hypothetical protein